MDVLELTNPRAERVRRIARLWQGVARRRAGRFVVEGPQAVREALRPAALRDPSAPGAVRELYVTAAAAARHPGLVAAATDGGIPVWWISDEVLSAMAGDGGTQHPQGVLAVANLVGVALDAALANSPRLVAVLARVRDPGNAGTAVRVADAAGAGAVVLTGESVDVHNPKCVRATSGSLFHLAIAEGEPLAGVVDVLRGAGMTVLAADGSGDVDLDGLQDDAARGRGPLVGPVAWVFGNEAWGLTDADRALVDAVVRIPIHGAAESLNLATAAAVCCYATARAQRTPERS